MPHNAENGARRRIDQRDEFTTDLLRLWEAPGVIRYDAQDHERMAWIVFDLIEAAKAEAGQKAAREALLDAADYLLPGDTVGPEFLIYLAVTKYGRAEFDPFVANGLIRRGVIPPEGSKP